jgi:hypothetical protein
MGSMNLAIAGIWNASAYRRLFPAFDGRPGRAEALPTSLSEARMCAAVRRAGLQPRSMSVTPNTHTPEPCSIGSMNIHELLQTLSDRIAGSASIKNVYGEPVTVGNR